MKVDYTLTPEWAEAFQVQMQIRLIDIEREQAILAAEEIQRKATQKLFEDNLQRGMQQIALMMNSPWVQLGNEIRRDPAQEPMVNMLNEDELPLRESIIRQNHGLQNCAPGSPLYDRVMCTNTHAPQPIPDWTVPRVKTSTQVKIAFCMLGFSIGVFCVLITLAVTQ